MPSVAIGARSLGQAPVATQNVVADVNRCAGQRICSSGGSRLRAWYVTSRCAGAHHTPGSLSRSCSRPPRTRILRCPHTVGFRQTKEISDEYCGQSYRWQAEALMALQEAAEVYSWHCTHGTVFVFAPIHADASPWSRRLTWCIYSRTLTCVPYTPNGSRCS